MTLSGVQRAMGWLESCGDIAFATDLDPTLNSATRIPLNVRDPTAIQALDAVLNSKFLPVNDHGTEVACPGEIKGRCTRKCLARALIVHGTEPVIRAFDCAKKLSDSVKNFVKDINAPAVQKDRRTENTLGDSYGKKALLKIGVKTTPRQLPQEIMDSRDGVKINFS